MCTVLENLFIPAGRNALQENFTYEDEEWIIFTQNEEPPSLWDFKILISLLFESDELGKDNFSITRHRTLKGAHINVNSTAYDKFPKAVERLRGVRLYDQRKGAIFSVVDFFEKDPNSHQYDIKFNTNFLNVVGNFINLLGRKQWEKACKIKNSYAMKLLILFCDKFLEKKKKKLEFDRVRINKYTPAGVPRKWISKQRVYIQKFVKQIREIGILNIDFSFEKSLRKRNEGTYTFSLAKTSPSCAVEDVEVIAGIYSCTCTETEEVYVGQSKNIHKRIEQHTKKLRAGEKTGLHWQSEWNKHGEDNFKWDIIEKIKDLGCLKEREKYWISYYDFFGLCAYNRIIQRKK